MTSCLLSCNLIELGFNDTSALVGCFHVNQSPYEKGSTLKIKSLLPNLLPFRIDPFSEVSKNNLMSPMKVCQYLLTS